MPWQLPISISLSIMPCSTVSSLAISTSSTAYFTVWIIYPPMLKSPSPSRASLVRHSLYKLNRIGDRCSGYHIKRKMCVGNWRGWGWGILRCVLGKLEGTKHLNVPGFEERIILNGSARNGSNMAWDDLSLEGDFCQAVVKTTVKHWIAWNVWNWLNDWGTVGLLGRIVLRAVSDYFV